MSDNTATTTDLDSRLADYTGAEQRLVEFLSTYREVIERWDALQSDRDVAALTLKESARAAGHGAKNEMFAVTVQPKMRRWFDADTVLLMAPYVREIPGVMVASVDKEKINALAKNGMLPPDVVTAASREEVLTTAVSVKRQPGALFDVERPVTGLDPRD